MSIFIFCEETMSQTDFSAQWSLLKKKSPQDKDRITRAIRALGSAFAEGRAKDGRSDFLSMLHALLV